MTDRPADRLERSAAFWLRAYPPAWRAQRADEVTAVLVDLAPDGARRLDARTALGPAARRGRDALAPDPAAARVPAVPDARPPRAGAVPRVGAPGHRAPGSLRRNLLGRLWLFAFPLYQAIDGRVSSRDPAWWAALAVALAASLLCVRPSAAVRRRLQHHARRGRRTSRATSAGSSGCGRPRARIAAEPGARVLVLLLAVGAVAWSAAAVLAPDPPGVRCRAVPACFESVDGAAGLRRC